MEFKLLFAEWQPFCLNLGVSRLLQKWVFLFSGDLMVKYGTNRWDIAMAKLKTAVTPVASFTKEVNLRLAKRPLKTNGRFANRGLTSSVKEATRVTTVLG